MKKTRETHTPAATNPSVYRKEEKLITRVESAYISEFKTYKREREKVIA
jgi:hypothetical protein